MAGKFEESFNLNFQANSIHSGSISFGRFETEPLSWERKSSFSHNRYLEEVEKFSKPGSVIEKKAYFEAHFKKKGLFGILPSASHNGSDQTTSENGGSDRLSYQEEVEPNENGHDDTVNIDKSTTLDEAYGNETKLNEGTRNSDESLRTENMIVTEAAGDVKESTLHDHMNSSPKETRPVPEMNSSANNVQIKKTKSSKSSRDHHARSLCKESPRRPNTEKNVSKLPTSPSTCSVSRSLKEVSRSEEKVIRESKSEKVSRVKKGPESQPCVLKADSRRTQDAKRSILSYRVNHTVKSTKSDLRPMTTTFNFKSSERAQRRKEEKTDSEIKRLRKSLNFKATPMPSFYRTALASQSDGDKAVSNNSRINKKVQKPKCEASEAEAASLSSNLKTGKDQTANKAIASSIEQHSISIEKTPPRTDVCSIDPALPTNQKCLPNSVTNNQNFGKKERQSDKGKEKGEGIPKHRNEIRKMSMRSNNDVQIGNLPEKVSIFFFGKIKK